MVKPLSEDLRIRVIEAVAGGQSCRQAAARFGVSASSAIRWVARWHATGEKGPRKLGGDRRSRLKPHRDVVLGVIAEQPDLTLEEIRAALAERGLAVSYGAVWRFLAGEGISFKKNRVRRRADAPRRGAGAGALAGRPAGA